MNEFEEIKDIYNRIKRDIEQRIDEFKGVWRRGDDYELFSEFAFCLLTPQSKARVCWNVILDLLKDDLLFYGSVNDIKSRLVGVRFKNNKARYLVEARERFFKDGRFILIDPHKNLTEQVSKLEKIIGEFQDLQIKWIYLDLRIPGKVFYRE